MGCAGSATHSPSTNLGTDYTQPKPYPTQQTVHPAQQPAPTNQVNPYQGYPAHLQPHPSYHQHPYQHQQQVYAHQQQRSYFHSHQPTVHPQQPPPPYSEHPPVQHLSKPPVHQQSQPPPQQLPPQQPQSSVAPPPQQDGLATGSISQTESVEFNEALVTTLTELDRSISQLERRNVLKQHKLKNDQLVALTAQVKQLTEQQQQLEAQTQKEYQDVVNLQSSASVRAMMSQLQFDQQMTKEQQEYMDALNRQEMHKKQLHSAVHNESVLKSEVHQLYQASEELKALYDKQDGILSSIFDGKYGSELEYSLEKELDHLMERKQRISMANYKWKNSRVLIHHACSQFGFAVRRWSDVVQVPATNQALKYQFAAEARNNLVAGMQNIDSAHRYLSTITFPYCSPDELKTVNTALQYIFTDLHVPERHKHAFDCYSTVYRRSAALVQWFDRVINKTILSDLDKATKECAAKKRQLKLERLGLIKERIREKAGDDVADKLEMSAEAAGIDEEGEEPEDTELADLVEADTVSQAAEDEFTNGGEASDGPTPLSTEELAATPPVTDIFGNIEELKRQHEEQMKQISEQQELSKARANEDLQAKLAQRKSRRVKEALKTHTSNPGRIDRG